MSLVRGLFSKLNDCISFVIFVIRFLNFLSGHGHIPILEYPLKNLASRTRHGTEHILRLSLTFTPVFLPKVMLNLFAVLLHFELYFTQGQL